MTGLNHNFSKMFRWLKEKKKSKHERKDKVEDDYGFRKKHIILQETENGHSVIIKDNETTLVYPQSFCRFHYRARMPTPVQNTETSNHIYDEIPEHCVRTRLNFGQTNSANESDLIKDTRASNDPRVDLQNAIEVGPYLIVPIVNTKDSKGDVEVFKKDINEVSENEENVPGLCNCNKAECSECVLSRLGSNAWDTSTRGADIIRDSKIVLTRCVKSKTGLSEATNLQQVCSVDKNQRSDLCSFTNGAQSNECESRIFSDSPSNDSNSRTLTGSPVSSARTPDTLSERSESCAIANMVEDVTGDLSKDCTDPICKSVNARLKDLNTSRHSKDPLDGTETNYEFDLSTSGESDHSRTSEKGDYELYLSKIESNLQLKHNVRKMVQDIESMTHGIEDQDKSDLDSMTYVSSLSEYSSAASHISDVSADRSASDDSSGYYECLDDSTASREKDKEKHVSLERSVSAPETDPLTLKSKVLVKNKKSKEKTGSKTKKQQYQRSKSFDCRVYKSLSDEDREMYKFPSNSNSSSSLSSRQSRNKPVLAPQPTPVYMDPYRVGKPGSHNRLLGDLIRMNYDKQQFFH